MTRQGIVLVLRAAMQISQCVVDGVAGYAGQLHLAAGGKLRPLRGRTPRSAALPHPVFREPSTSPDAGATPMVAATPS